ncbi:DUF4190 domain-containing protein [Nocardia higoensis]|uniref:DUF4190 domain-containing protein n=1 Tax=Nocardia higoensis TaxID=228599 RepID=A0ABS0DJ88_9NOCA|nr:DUF4190 domain-containing protein [Nocardia higoensis]MBF6356743.1 DUF4190 domain-containing protein [Nocardia higoensis]
MSQYPPPGRYPPPGQYPPPPGQYPPPGQEPGASGGYWQESPKRTGLALTTLVLGILALVSFWTVVGGYLLGVLGIVFGIVAAVKARNGSAGGMGMTITGLVLSVLALIGATLFVIVGWSLFVDVGGKDLVDCLNKAGNDQAAIDECERRWTENIEDRFSITLTPAPVPTP